MKRVVISLWIALASVCLAAEGDAQEAAAHGGGSVTWWKVANFVLLAAGLGYLMHKKGGPFFGARSREIRQAIDEAARLKAEAEARAAEIEQRLSSLASEVEALRRSARQETAAEAERAGARLRQEISKVQAEAEQEIASAAQTARRELRAYAADLAVRLAEQQLRSRMSPEAEERLMGAAIAQLRSVAGSTPETGRSA